MGDRRFVTGHVTGCDDICDGSSFRNYLIDNKCDGVTAQNPGGSFAVSTLSWTKWRKTAFLQESGIAPFFNFGFSNLLPIRVFPLKPGDGKPRDFSNFWRISPGGGVWGGRASGDLAVKSAALRIMRIFKLQSKLGQPVKLVKPVSNESSRSGLKPNMDASALP
jgi:hypothetical protein